MTLPVTQNGDNAFVPGVWAQSYVPDQLIADSKLIVTQNIVVGGGAALPRGSVLGQQSVTAPANAVAAGQGGGGANTGNGVISAITLGAKAQQGAYAIKFTGATAYTVEDPNGEELPAAAAAGAYSDPQIGFTFTAGGTPMVAGDGFTLTVAPGSGNYVLSTTAATDGSQNPKCILVDAADATGGNVAAGGYFGGEFNGNALNLGTGWTVAAVTAALPAPIFIKPAVSASDPSGE